MSEIKNQIKRYKDGGYFISDDHTTADIVRWLLTQDSRDVLIYLINKECVHSDVKQISEALRNYGLTLIKTANGYDVLKTGNMVAQNERI